MSYKLRADETVGDSLQRIICEQIECAIHASGRPQNGKGSPVHETRKHLKKARAALRLVSNELKHEVWKREDACLGKAGRLISEVRDAEVRLQTVQQLRQFARGKKGGFRETEEFLAFELDSFLAAFSEWPREAQQRLNQVLHHIKDARLDDLDCKQVRKSVQKTYKRGRDALKLAARKNNAKKLHTLRKRAKELWYQLRILQPIAPSVFSELSDELRAIGQYLGQVHDLAFVGERLSSIGPVRKRGDRILNALIGAREDELQRTAIALGERFYAERPRQFARRISKYFSDWETARLRCPPADRRSVTLLN